MAESDWFYETANKAVKILSPVELLVRYEKILSLKFESPRDALLLQRALGQVLFAPPNVAGWPGGKTWIDNATLLFRLNLATVFFQSTEIDFKSKDDPEESEAKERLTRTYSRERQEAEKRLELRAYQKVVDADLAELEKKMGLKFSMNANVGDVGIYRGMTEVALRNYGILEKADGSAKLIRADLLDSREKGEKMVIEKTRDYKGIEFIKAVQPDVREIVGADSAMLEFELEIDGIRINGIDLMRWNAANQLTEFKVMLRPLKAVNIIHQKMGEMLAKAV